MEREGGRAPFFFRPTPPQNLRVERGDERSGEATECAEQLDGAGGRARAIGRAARLDFHDVAERGAVSLEHLLEAGNAVFAEWGIEEQLADVQRRHAAIRMQIRADRDLFVVEDDEI